MCFPQQMVGCAAGCCGALGQLDGSAVRAQATHHAQLTAFAALMKFVGVCLLLKQLPPAERECVTPKKITSFQPFVLQICCTVTKHMFLHNGTSTRERHIWRHATTGSNTHDARNGHDGRCAQGETMLARKGGCP